MSKSAAEDPKNYVVTIEGDPGVSIVGAVLQPNPFYSKQILLTLSKPISAGKVVKIVVNNVKDLNGNVISNEGNQFGFNGK